MPMRSNKFGVNLMVWNGQVGAAELALLPKIKEMGYDSVELPVFAADAFAIPTVKDAVQAAGLVCTVSTALPATMNLIDAERRAAGVTYLQGIIKVAADVGATLICGPLAAP